MQTYLLQREVPWVWHCNYRSSLTNARYLLRGLSTLQDIRHKRKTRVVARMKTLDSQKVQHAAYALSFSLALSD